MEWDLSGVPIHYLESYPFPAFVASIPPGHSGHRTHLPSSSPGSIVWSNAKWREAMRRVQSDGQGATAAVDELLEWVEQPDSTEADSFLLDADPSTKLLFAKTSMTPPTTSTALAYRVVTSTDCQYLLDHTDWSKTSLGPRSTWSPVIEAMINTVMYSKTQDALWLGPEFNMIYNDNYSAIVDHPALFGKSANSPEAWGPVWESVIGLIDRCLNEGEACYRKDDLLLYRRGPRGHFVEKYHTWSFVPLFDNETGKVLGLFNPTMETTEAVLAQRRQETLRDVAEQVLLARTTGQFFDGLAEMTARNPKDVPFLLCYSVGGEAGGVQLILESSVGVPKDHPAAPATVNVLSSSIDLISRPVSGGTRCVTSYDDATWPFAQALGSRRSIIVDDCSKIITGLPLRQWDHLPESAIVVPIWTDTSTGLPRAVLILGLNLLCPLDSAYEDWIHVLRAHLTSSLSSVRAYEAEQQRLLDKERMERAKTAWFQGAAHDIRTPLTLVAGPLEDALATALTPKQRSSLVLAQRNVARIQRLITSLFDFSRIEAGKLSGRFVPTDLGRFVGDLAALFRPAAERRQITFNVELDPSESSVYIDPLLLETVVTNLLSNALKYTEQGNITIRLAYGSHADIDIIDTGCGIPAGELEAVTDRFHRATTALARGIEGTGIGLALAKEILGLHGGELFIYSQTAEETGGPHGSTFRARIPLVERSSDVDGPEPASFGAYGKAVAADAMQWNQSDDWLGTPVSETPSDLERHMVPADVLVFDATDTVLLVDDNRDMRAYIKRIFTPYCSVIEATDGEEALAIARANPPNLILSDMMMPKLDGHGLLVAIRNDPKTRLVPMVLLSAASDDDVRFAALTAGAEDFILKPFKPKELLARVQLHMQVGKRLISLEALYAQREKEIALLSDYCPSGIVRADAAGNLQYCNDAWRMFAGMGPDEDPLSWPQRVDQQTLAQMTTQWDEIIRGDQRETHMTWKWLTGKTVSATFIRLDKVDPAMSGILGCLSDISYQEERMQEAERRRIEAEESKRQQELIVDVTSHEIRTPVSAILHCSSLVKENLAAMQAHLHRGDSLKPREDLLRQIKEDIEALESIHQCGLVQERIANDVLSLARVQLDMLTFYDVDMNLRQQTQKILAVFGPEVKMKNIELRLEFGESLDQSGITIIKTDHVRLGQIMTNLISNAIRFTAPSSVRRITVRLDVAFSPPTPGTCAAPPVGRHLPSENEDIPVWLYVAVSDTGPGLTPDESAVLFQQFSQGSKMVHSRYGGSGLGLFICRKMAELLGGRIEVVSKPGAGSVFRFFIQSSTPPRQSVAAPVEERPPVSEVPVDIDMLSDRMRVLLVEDNIISQTVLKRQLVKAGLTCDVANHGQEALNLIFNDKSPEPDQWTSPYDVVFMDLEMPIMDGVTAVKQIRKTEQSSSLAKQTVIALTGNARQERIDQALAAGMDDVVIKPYKLNDLLERVRKAVSKEEGEHISS